ncbi:putative ABC-type dipeptide transport system,periplasmic component [Vibrio nigripulchritudo SO65]|uniref:ABC transporter substrate-binding protein n=1 Tax=Vibrio nigripulchritudo TaxID=28173 RepID=UPI0003B1F47E|nr:ABC transporter substrate-binding protein [Vibrio nigripulchritudo]CCN35246.1 putative ABC-type dipeptide transport system,periplasmic component [Vibrio nigripulchritudo AM115]CCN40338.1 putative ABC-type dipeptide transport system,periplasmic component [Vibrio nigripulchritudo FTn2]CCN63253.1 putative ABC-type dipeptide transport system,periplasmic component [Vibrio nigripulchritudo POn4]CCN76950.1 putative ABC-type dipeptide transport system,periplasmic component [Vibrio nigripulchritudo S
MKKLAVAVALSCVMASPLAMADIKQGGSMIVTYKDDVSTLDPAIGYDWQNWSMIKSLFDGLMDYKPGTTELVPDLAESYTISEDGKTYTFKLKKGIKFHNGREVKAADIKYSIERTVNPATQSPGAGFFGSLEGFDAFNSGQSKGLASIKAVDDYTVSFQLSRPDATFLHVLAINFAFVVPKESVEKWGADFGKHPVGTGAFKLGEWKLGQQLTFVRNSDYNKPGLPYLDEIRFEVGQEPVVALLRLEKGEVDIAGDGIPPAKFLQMKNSPQYKPLIIAGDQLHTGYITMNVKMKPFDNVKVRQAVNMAINKRRIVQIINGRATPANQPLPPAMPGYSQSYKGYAYDPDGAKKLLADAGLGDGFTTELYVANTDPQPRIAQAIQQDLAKIGVKTEIKALAQANVIAAGGVADQAPMIWSGGMAWIADFPDPSNFYGPILGCGGAVDGGWNWSWYCNQSLDDRAAKADAMVSESQQSARMKEWESIYVDLMADAPWVPVFNERRFTIRSERLGGDTSIFVDPVHIPVNYENVWVKDVQ